MAAICANTITIGDEVLAGDVVDTNRAYLGQRCRALGLEVVRSLSVRDRTAEIAACLVELAGDCDVCLVTGGLGPTTDDVTAEAVAAASKLELVRNPQVVEHLRTRFAARGRDLLEANLKQADLPRGAVVLSNPIGTAPGFLVELAAGPRACAVICMPGVPSEMHRMMLEQVEPRLRQRFDLRPTSRRTYRILGVGESAVQARVGDWLDEVARKPGMTELFVHYRASAPEVHVTCELLGPGSAEREEALSALDVTMVRLFGTELYGIGTADLAERVVRALRSADKTLSTAESCTGGMVGGLLTQVPGASNCFRGGVIAYDDGVKRALLGVPDSLLAEHGAVSEPVARAMAQGVRREIGSDLSVAVTGIAGPDGGTDEKRVGTVHLAVSDQGLTSHKHLRAWGNRGNVRRISARWALKLVWDRLVEQGLARCEALSGSPRREAEDPHHH